MPVIKLSEKKSYLKNLKQGEILFKDKEKASSLYIIQSGQIRLFKPKGEGYIEIALLRAGEVMGEMAFWGEDGSSYRSCSAEALIPSEVIEVPFSVLKKTIQGLNPWFRVVLNTMAERLRKANERVKSLESNNVGHGPGSTKNYKFFMTNDVIRSLSVLFLVMKGQGKNIAKGVELDLRLLIFYVQDIFGVAEVKFLEFCHILADQGLCSLVKSEDSLDRTLIVKDVPTLKNLMIFFNTQKVSADDKQMKISYRCEAFLERIMQEIEEKKLAGDMVELPLASILAEFKDRGKKISIKDLKDAITQGLVGEASVLDEGELILPVNMKRIRKMFIFIKVMNAIERFNESKQKAGRYT